MNRNDFKHMGRKELIARLSLAMRLIDNVMPDFCPCPVCHYGTATKTKGIIQNSDSIILVYVCDSCQDLSVLAMYDDAHQLLMHALTDEQLNVICDTFAAHPATQRLATRAKHMINHRKFGGKLS